ncbi:unnamed protein product [marine sediment metagenome]|uniref:Uncharacterized protein n=1 Tax=marine sediment metagenome TaxID=412755 RepID=X0TTV5_9ZZZZ
MSIKSQIERLTLQERRQLSHAFDCGISQYVVISETIEFVGVHLDQQRNKHLQIIEQLGVWSYGRVIK